MRGKVFAIWLVAGALFLVVRVAIADDPDPVAADEQVLKAAKVGTDGPALLDFFRRRTVTDTIRERVSGLIKMLGDESFAVREQASRDLTVVGPAALPQLRAAARDADLEVKRRAERCRRSIEEANPNEIVAAAARLLAVRRPAGAAEALLAYLPEAGPESLGEEMVAALAALSVRDGKPDERVLAALTDKVPVRRAAAVEALCRAGVKDRRKLLLALLEDADLPTRMRAGLALAGIAHEKAAVPVLIELLAELPAEQLWPIEDFLGRLAGEQAPASSPEDGTRRKIRDAWASWWKANRDNADLTKLEQAPRPLGYTLIVLLDGCKVVEVDRAGKTRWEIAGLHAPLDAQLLPNGHVLVAESRSKRVTERDRAGKILWEKQMSAVPIGAQRISNGNTFIATAERLVEVDREGKEVYSYDPPKKNVVAARRLRDGRVAFVANGTVTTIDRFGKELKSFPVGNGVHTTSALDVLANGHVLATAYAEGRVREYDAGGKVVWEAAASAPIGSVRLPSGNTLTSSQDGTVFELDRNGKKVWEHRIEGHPTRARGR
jgi:HEAT repeat protein